MNNSFDVAVVGATGVVGDAMLSILEEREFPVRGLYPLASHRSAGSCVQFRGVPHTVGDLEDFDFSKVRIALFSAGASVSARHAPRAGEAGCIVVDNSSQFRYDDDVPLVVPEVNSGAIAQYSHRNIIANPNCSTIQMVVALKPIHTAVGIERINVATYQSVSGRARKPSTNSRPRPLPCSMESRPIARSTRSRSRSTRFRTSTYSWRTATRRKR